VSTLRVTAILVAAFLVGAAGAEGAVRVRRAGPAASTERPDAAVVGDLVSLELRDDAGTVSRSRLVTPAGRSAEMTLRDAEDPGVVRLVLRVATGREASGDISVDYSLRVPALQLDTSGRVSVVPGVESAFDISPDLRAVVTALPVPSKAFDRWVERERQRRAPHSS
jgi:hypothetical protein